MTGPRPPCTSIHELPNVVPASTLHLHVGVTVLITHPMLWISGPSKRAGASRLQNPGPKKLMVRDYRTNRESVLQNG